MSVFCDDNSGLSCQESHCYSSGESNDPYHVEYEWHWIKAYMK